MLALCLMLLMSHYTHNYAGVIGGSLSINEQRPIQLSTEIGVTIHQLNLMVNSIRVIVTSMLETTLHLKGV